MKQWQMKMMMGGGIISLVFIAFGRSLLQDFSPIDDGFLIINNLAAHGVTIDHLKTISTSYDPELYIPFTFLTFQINYMMSGLSAWSYHLTNLLLHAGNALLVGWLLFLLTRRRGIAIAPMMLFAVHPLHTEAIVWVAGRKDLLAMFFFLTSFISYLRSRERGWTYIMVSLFFFLCALLSKAVVMTLPAVLILTDLLLERRPIDRRMVLEKTPYIGLSALFIVIALGGKERVLQSSSLWETSLMAMKSSVFYIEKLTIPIHLSVFYPFDGSITITSPTFFTPAMIVLALVMIAFLAFRRAPLISWGILFFFITLSPTFFNFHKGAQMFFAVDRYAYIPSIGFLLAVLWIVGDLMDRWMGHASSLMKNLMIGILVLLFMTMSMTQTTRWDSAESLFTHAMEMYPRSPFTRVNLVALYREQGNLERAFSLLREGLRYGTSPMLSMEAGLLYSAAGQVTEAQKQFQDVIQIDPHNPEPYYNLGFLDEHEEKNESAKERYEQAVTLDPSYVVARTALANLLLQEGERALAEEHYRTAIQWNPNAVDARIGLAVILSLKGDEDGAMKELMTTVQLDSSSEQRFNTLKAEIQ